MQTGLTRTASGGATPVLRPVEDASLRVAGPPPGLGRALNRESCEHAIHVMFPVGAIHMAPAPYMGDSFFFFHF